MIDPQSGLSSSRASFEEELLEALRFSNLEKQQLAALVKIIADLRTAGFKGFRPLPRGTPAIDGLTVQTIVDAQTFSSAIARLAQTPRLVGIKIFPYGIPNPEWFEVGIDMG